ncbi:MAG: SsrA-binding protein SmpB [Sedimentisphaerales bacterium]|jgi:SsrA-binding protein|nr:SsrA-binding protein SmpB [Sedimentisphaerales bacterium]
MSGRKDKQSGNPPCAVNRKALHDFELLDRFEAGLVLTGSEVKSLRAGQADLTGAYARISDGECWLIGAKIAQYKQAGVNGHQPDRKRKCLLHKSQIRKIDAKLQQRGCTLVPLRIYFNQKGLAKAELALARGKRQYDKRRSIVDQEHRREMDRHGRR